MKNLARDAQLVLVIGSDNSSNSRRLREVAEMTGARAYLIEDASKIDPAWLEGVQCVAITAGASAPEYLVLEVVEYFRRLGVTEIQEIETVEERVTFTPPPELAHELARREFSSRPSVDSSSGPARDPAKLTVL